MGERKKNTLRVNFDGKLKLEFHGVKVTSDTGLLAYRGLDEIFGLMAKLNSEFEGNRTGKNTQHNATALLLKGGRVFHKVLNGKCRSIK